MVDLQRATLLLRALAAGQSLADAAEEADFDLEQARAALADLAERLEIQAKKLKQEEAQAKKKVSRVRETTDDPDKLRFAFDGGSRGNPGPAAGAGLALAEDGTVLVDRARYFSKATNNFAEYQGLLAALELAEELGVGRFRCVGDSELVVKQMKGEYKVKNKTLLRLFIEANNKLRRFKSWQIDYVPREENKLADKLVNQTLDEKAPKKKPKRR